MNAAKIPVYSILPFCATPESVCIADAGKVGIKVFSSALGKSSAIAGRNITIHGATIPVAVFLEENVAQTVSKT